MYLYIYFTYPNAKAKRWNNNELQTVAEIESFHKFLLLSYPSYVIHQIYAIVIFFKSDCANIDFSF